MLHVEKNSGFFYMFLDLHASRASVFSNLIYQMRKDLLDGLIIITDVTESDIDNTLGLSE